MAFSLFDGVPTLYLDMSATSVGIGTTSPDGTLHVFSASAGTITASTNADDLVVENNADGGLSILTPNTDVGRIFFGDPDDAEVGRINYDHASNFMSFWTAAAERMRINSAGNTVIGTTTPAGKLHVDQASTTAAIPVMYLDQADISEEFFEFATTIGTGNAIEAVGAKTLTPTHFLKCTINGVGTRYIAMGTIA